MAITQIELVDAFTDGIAWTEALPTEHLRPDHDTPATAPHRDDVA
jgi:hypothetical protein